MRVFEDYLKKSNYDKRKTKYLIEGFSKGFSIGYEGPTDRKDTAKNIPLRDMGTETDLWNKVMEEVELQWYSGPYTKEDIENLFDGYIQSPIGLVPKAGGKTRLIFHLSYDFQNGNASLNAHTPKDKRQMLNKVQGLGSCFEYLHKTHTETWARNSSIFRKNRSGVSFSFIAGSCFTQMLDFDESSRTKLRKDLLFH